MEPAGDSSTARYFDELLSELTRLTDLRREEPSLLMHSSVLLSDEIHRVWGLLHGNSGGDHNQQPQRPRAIINASPPNNRTPPTNRTPSVNRAPTNRTPMNRTPRTPNGIFGNRSSPLTLTEKIPIPDVPDGKDLKGRKCNLIGRILGPSGLSVKQLEAKTGCQILIRGHGSVKDEARQARLRGSPGWEHLSEPLHVVVAATDNDVGGAQEKLKKGIESVRWLLRPSHDEYKKRQLMQLAIINGTYRHN